MRVKMADIAKEADVSLSLVSRLLRDDPTLKVTQATRERVMKAKRRLGGYQPRATKQNKAGHVIVPINRIFAEAYCARYVVGSPLWTELERGLHRAGCRLSVAFFDEANRMETLREWMNSPQSISGLFLLTGLVDQAMADILHERRFPHVCVDRQVQALNVNTVCADEETAVRLSMEHLFALGCKEIVYLGLRGNYYRYFMGMMAEAGLPSGDNLFCETPWPAETVETPIDWRKAAAQALTQWLETHPAPEALYCRNDDMALGAIDALRQRDIRPGRDIDIIGYDNIEQQPGSQIKRPMLTTVEHPYAEIGRHCAYRLIEQMNHREQRSVFHEYLPVHLIVRKSTRPLGDRADSK